MRLSSRKHQRSSKPELSMTSMIDVVFLLLIFFMTTASFVRTERNLDSAIKVRRSSPAEAQSDLEPAIIDIVASEGEFVYKLGTRVFSDEEELLNVLRQFDNKVDGCFVRVSDAAPFRMAAAAIQAGKSAEFLTVSYVPLQSANP